MPGSNIGRWLRPPELAWDRRRHITSSSRATTRARARDDGAPHGLSLQVQEATAIDRCRRGGGVGEGVSDLYPHHAQCSKAGGRRRIDRHRQGAGKGEGEHSSVISSAREQSGGGGGRRRPQ